MFSGTSCLHKAPVNKTVIDNKSALSSVMSGGNVLPGADVVRIRKTITGHTVLDVSHPPKPRHCLKMRKINIIHQRQGNTRMVDSTKESLPEVWELFYRKHISLKASKANQYTVKLRIKETGFCC